MSELKQGTTIGGFLALTEGDKDVKYRDIAKTPENKDATVSVTVGTGGNYATINDALVYLSKLYPVYKKNGFTAEIKLLSGFILKEQVLIKGLDLGWITINSVDAEVTIDASFLTAYVGVRRPAFYVYNGTHPVINVLFNMINGSATKDQDGLVCENGRGTIIEGKGFKNANGVGIHALNCGEIYARGAIASGAKLHGIHANSASSIFAHSADASGATTNGVYALGFSRIDARNVNARKVAGSDGTADFVSMYGSNINLSDTSIGGTSLTVNTLTKDGVIYK